MSEENNAQANNNSAQGPQMSLQHIYLKDASFEAKSPHELDNASGQPDVNLNLAQRTTDMGEGRWEVILTVTVTAKEGEKTIFVCEVQYGGIFMFSHFTEEQMPYAINVLCPNVLYPYNRAKIADLVVAGGFMLPPMQPINFETVFRQRIADAQAQNGDAPPSTQ